jgi:hypothetical protein
VDRVRSVVDAFDDANVALRSIAQDSECGLVAGAVVGGNRLGEAVELDQYGALINPDLISFGNTAAGEVATATDENGRNGAVRTLGSHSANHSTWSPPSTGLSPANSPDRDIVLPGQIAADTSETGTKATRGHFLNSFGEAVIIAELDHAAVAAERVAQLTEG